MSSFSEVVDRDKPVPPARVFVVPTSAWAESYEMRPRTEIAVGIRTLSEDDAQVAKSEALKLAAEFIGDSEDEQQLVDVYNDALMREVVSRCMTDPNDVRRPYHQMGELSVRQSMRSEGVARVWDEWVAHQKGCDPSMPEASDDDIEDLAARLESGQHQLSEDDERRVRRLLSWCLEEVRGDG